jgi:hypothetical protein
MARRLTLKKFREYLEDRPGLEFDMRGSHARSSWCPLATFLTTTTGQPHSVDGYIYWDWHADKSGNLPPWANKFIAKFDALGAGKFTASKCLKILKEVA